MNRKLIIDNRVEGLPDASALCMVINVVDLGEISETRGRKHYCLASRTKDGIMVCFIPGKKSDRFLLYKEDEL